VKYECFIKPGFYCQDIEADNAESARRQFAELIRDNLEAEHVIANNLDTEDGEDPSPNAPVSGGTPSAQVAGSDLPICRVCDGGPGNNGVCLCGEHAYGPNDPAEVRKSPQAGGSAICPGPECPYCAGEACQKCGPGPTLCDHDNIERHERNAP